MRVAIVAEYYPRHNDPVLGIWAHQQAVAARDAGADVSVLVLHRPVPARSQMRESSLSALVKPLSQPLKTELDGIPITYVPFLAPPRWRSYSSWGAWAAPSLRIALNRLHKHFPFDLIHAHYAAPAGDAVRRAFPTKPTVISVHGGDLLSVPNRSPYGRRVVQSALRHAEIVLANSTGMMKHSTDLGARRAQVIHLGTDVPPQRPVTTATKELVTVAHLVGRKRHIDVMHALALLRPKHPDISWTIIGDGPERSNLERAAQELGVADIVAFLGQLPPTVARTRSQRAALFVLPSVDEAFGVAYIEAMAAGIPTVACAGEHGPEEIAAHGGGIELIPPLNPAALAAELDRLLSTPQAIVKLSQAARETVEQNFTWSRCGQRTVAAYEEALKR